MSVFRYSDTSDRFLMPGRLSAIIHRDLAAVALWRTALIPLRWSAIPGLHVLPRWRALMDSDDSE